MKTLRFPRGSTHLHERDFTEAERLVLHEFERVFPERASVTLEMVNAHWPLCQAMMKIQLMRSFDVFGGIFVPLWLSHIGDPEGKWEGLFWYYFTRDFEAITDTILFVMEEERHLQALFGEHGLDEGQPDIPDDDPLWAEHDAHMDQYRATLAAKRETWKLSTAMQKVD